MPGLAEGGGQIPNTPVSILSPTLCGCWVQVFSWLPQGRSTPYPASVRQESYSTGWLWAAWPFSHPLLHLSIFGFAATLAPPSRLGAGWSMVTFFPLLLAWTAIAPFDCPGLWVTQPLPAGLPWSHNSSNVLSDSRA